MDKHISAMTIPSFVVLALACLWISSTNALEILQSDEEDKSDDFLQLLSDSLSKRYQNGDLGFFSRFDILGQGQRKKQEERNLDEAWNSLTNPERYRPRRSTKRVNI
ncbi:uncharacterized protein LOC111124532 [Crassostrea virginica]